MTRRFQHLSEHSQCVFSENIKLKVILVQKLSEVMFDQFGQEQRLRKKFLTLLDPPVTSHVKKINSKELYLMHLEMLFPMPLEFFRSEL